MEECERPGQEEGVLAKGGMEKPDMNHEPGCRHIRWILLAAKGTNESERTNG